MHFSCFGSYIVSLEARHAQHPTRNHPEVLMRREFMCPLCKSLGNCLLPVVWTERVEKVNWSGSVRPEGGEDGKEEEENALEGLQRWWDTRVGDFVRDMRQMRAKVERRTGFIGEDDDEDEAAEASKEQDGDPREGEGENEETVEEEEQQELLAPTTPGGITQRFRRVVSQFVSNILVRGRTGPSGTPSRPPNHFPPVLTPIRAPPDSPYRIHRSCTWWALRHKAGCAGASAYT